MVKFNFTNVILILLVMLTGCDSKNDPLPVEQPSPVISPPVVVPSGSLPIIENIVDINNTIDLYGKYELRISLNAPHSNPYDQQDIALDATFTGPNKDIFKVAGFWDTRLGWILRFSPSQIGLWSYSVKVTNVSGVSEPVKGTFVTVSSTKRGSIQVANNINKNYSSRYFMHQNGSEFYGVGHGDAFSIHRNTESIERLLARMKQANENYFIWWPFFDFSPVRDRYDHYDQANIDVIESVIELTEREELTLVFTIWDHSQLRDSIHPWGEGLWDINNGFSQLTDINSFFSDDTSWRSQQNLYRYIIARWGYSSAIAMWQTVSEINGTNAFENTDVWHVKINQYFVDNDPYRHPTTASKAGDLDWPEGHAVMDSPQVHIYRDLLTDKNDPKSPAKVIESAEIIAKYTNNMWLAQEKPNWIGEFGVINDPSDESKNSYPEVFHNALWSALVAGAAMTPAEWNDFDEWEEVTQAMQATLNNFSRFVGGLSLAEWAPNILNINAPNSVNVWGIAGNKGGVIWLQDATLRGNTIDNIRTLQSFHVPLTLEVTGLSAGEYDITPYNTRSGEFLAPKVLVCNSNSICFVDVDSFNSDIAFKLEARPSL